MSDQRILVTVSRISNETEHIKSFHLRRADGTPLPAFHAGDHIDVHLPNGLTRQYSLCNGPADTSEYHIGVKNEPLSRGGSRALHELVGEGSTLEIGAPRSSFPLTHGAQRYLLLAGGIGITPILSMAKHLHAAGTPFTLHYFTQGLAHTPFLSSLDGALSEQLVLHSGLTPVEVVDKLDTLLAAAMPARLYYCGPLLFMEAIGVITKHLQWPADEKHFEHFTPVEASAGSEFRIELAQSGLSFVVPAEKTIIDVLAENGVAVPTSCGQGICGTCVVKVLDGVPDHRDTFLSEFQKKSGKKIALCVSRCVGEKLIIDM